MCCKLLGLTNDLTQITTTTFRLVDRDYSRKKPNLEERGREHGQHHVDDASDDHEIDEHEEVQDGSEAPLQ